MFLKLKRKLKQIHKCTWAERNSWTRQCSEEPQLQTGTVFYSSMQSRESKCSWLVRADRPSLDHLTFLIHEDSAVILLHTHIFFWFNELESVWSNAQNVFLTPWTIQKKWLHGIYWSCGAINQEHVLPLCLRKYQGPDNILLWLLDPSTATASLLPTGYFSMPALRV